MAAITQSLLPYHVFGIQPHICSGVHFMDDTTVVYTAGLCGIVVAGSADIEAFTAIALSCNVKYVAVAESLMPDRPMLLDPKKEVSDLTKAIDAVKVVPVITLYDSQTAKKKKMLMGGEVGSRSYVSVAFTVDNKSLSAEGSPQSGI